MNMKQYVPERKATDSPQLGGAQAPWGDLPFLSEMLQWFYHGDMESKEIYNEMKREVDKNQNKIEQLFNLSKKLGLLDDYDLLPSGTFVAESFVKPKQYQFAYTKSSPPLGVKSELSTRERSVFKTILFERDWHPMLATIHQIATTEVPDKDQEARANGFRDRVQHLNEFQEVARKNSWEHKLKARLQWVNHLEIAHIKREKFHLTNYGEQLHQQLASHYHPDW